MAKENNIPSHIHAELALLALQRAIAEIQFVEEIDISISDFRECFPAILDDLNEATYYLSNLKNPSTPASMFSYN
jgi:hypothetical protein